MRKALRIAWREYVTSVRTKGFLIGLVLAPILMGGSVIAIGLLKGHVDTTDLRIAVIDRSGHVAGTIEEAAEERNGREVHDAETGEKLKPAYVIEILEPDDDDPDAQRLALSNRVRAKALHAYVEVGSGVLHPRADRELSRIRYHARGAAVDDVRGWVQGVANNRLRRLRLEEAGATGPEYEDVLDWIWVEAMGLVTTDEATGEVRQAKKVNEWQTLAAPLIMIVLIFIMIMMGAVPQLSAVMEEKTQRIAEVLFAAVRPFELMLGKLIGGVAVSFTASAVYILIGTGALLYMGLTDYFDFGLLPWFLVYMVCAVLMMGSISAALGSACNDPKDAQNLGLPAMFPVMIPMFMIMPAVMQPNSPTIAGLSLFPLFTPILMLARQSTPAGIPAWQPWVGLAGVLLFTALSVWIGGRVFRVGMMMQGHKPGFRAIARWAIRG